MSWGIVRQATNCQPNADIFHSNVCMNLGNICDGLEPGQQLESPNQYIKFTRVNLPEKEEELVKKYLLFYHRC